MNFPDFLQFAPFNELREKMGASELGHFEFFDPESHLTAGERNMLVGGCSVPIKQLRCLDDATLAFKNSRVLVYVLAPRTQMEWEYHLAACSVFNEWLGPDNNTGTSTDVETSRVYTNLIVEVGIATAKPTSPMGQYHVCSHCLHELHYRGFDGVRNRHRQYAQSVQKAFNLAEFFIQYPLYPLRESVAVPLI